MSESAEREETVVLTARIPASLRRSLRRFANEHTDGSLSAAARRVIAIYFGRERAPDVVI